MDSSVSVSSCSSSSGEISSAKPVRVHTSMTPFQVGERTGKPCAPSLRTFPDPKRAFLSLDTPCGQATDQVPLEDHVEDDHRQRADHRGAHHLTVERQGPALLGRAECLEFDG